MERAREGVVILLNDVWHSVVIDFGCVSSRIIWISSGFQVWVVMGYGPNKGNGEVRKSFWNYLDRIVDDVRNGYGLCTL